MKVLIIHNLLWTHYKNKLYSELQQLAGTNFDIKVLQIARNERSRATMESMDKMPLDYHYEVLFEKYWEDIHSVELCQKLLQQINKFRPQVLNITGFYSWVHIFIILYCHLRGIKVILSNDSTAADQPAIGWKQLLKRFAISLCDGFFTFGTKATDYVKSLGAKNEQILANKCAVVDNDFIEKNFNQYFTDRSKLQLSQNVSAKNFIFVGRFLEIKNIFCLLEAFLEAKKASENAAEWGLILLGEGVLKEQLQGFIIERKISDVHFVGGMPWYEVPKFLAMADVLVLPSKSEPWGLVVNEAMVCGLPVIVSDKCGCAVDLVREGKNGYVFPYNNRALLTNYLLKFINNAPETLTMGETSKEIIQEYSPKQAAQAMLNGFDKIVIK